MASVEWSVVVVADDGTEEAVLSTASRCEADELAEAIGRAGNRTKVVERRAHDE
jgi:hypothetical protein